MLNIRHSALAASLGLAMILICGPAARQAAAQILYGGLVGNVTDESGASIPGASVTATNDQTGAVRTVQTTAEGVYRIPTLAPGKYTVRIEADGFRAYEERGAEVSVNNLTRIDAGLQLGQVSEQVTVEATAVSLQTDRAEVRHEVDATTLENVPIPVGRNYQMLLGTLPGFTPPRNAHSVPANPTRSVRYSVNGTSDMNNNVRID
ncbi:MAG: carboxypeptidase regulatory-like domain-containing protein, partial [Bryobacterales bacterium]|nr:carboxypeptidase regulatory-like domain-containing protein [Bryobacterales bacterium]